jgi:hypothetical protein
VGTTNDPMASALGGLVGALLNGAVQARSQTGQTEQPAEMGNILGSLLGGGAPRDASSAQGDVLGSLLGSMMSGGASTSQPSGEDALGALLGSLLSGSAPTAQPSGGEDALGALLGSLLGSGTPAGSSSSYPSQQMPSAGTDQLGSLLSGLLGVDTSGGARAIANNPIANAFVAPIAETLARKTGMAPGIAQVVVVFAINVLLAGVAQQGSRQQSSREELITKLQNGEPITQTYLKESGLLSQLVQETGLSQKTAAQSLQQVFRALGTQMSEGTPEERQQELQTFLRKWK